MPIVEYDQLQQRFRRESQTQPSDIYVVDQDGKIVPETPSNVGRPRTRPAPTPRAPGLPLLQLAIDGVCTLRATAPNDFSRRLVSASPFDIIPGVSNARERAFNRLCGETPNGNLQTVRNIPFIGGQCPGVAYTVSARFVGEVGNSVDDRTANIINVIGPVRGPFAEVVSDGRYNLGVAGTNSDGTIQKRSVIQIGGPSPGGRYTPQTQTILSVTPQNNGANNCGDPAARDSPVDNSSVTYNNNFTDLEITYETSPGNNITVPVGFAYVEGLGITIDVGGISLTFDGSNADITFETDLDAEEDIPELGGGGFTDNDRQRLSQTSTSQEIANISTSIADIDTSIADISVSIADIIADIGELRVDIHDKLECISNNLNASACYEIVKEFDSQVVDNVVSSVGDSVFYSLGARVRTAYILITIEDPIPSGFRVYKLTNNSEDIEAAFGNYSLYGSISESPSRNADDLRYLHTKYTLVQLPNVPIQFGIRLSVKPNCIATVTDLGYVYKRPELEDCFE